MERNPQKGIFPKKSEPLSPTNSQGKDDESRLQSLAGSHCYDSAKARHG